LVRLLEVEGDGLAAARHDLLDGREPQPGRAAGHECDLVLDLHVCAPPPGSPPDRVRPGPQNMLACTRELLPVHLDRFWSICEAEHTNSSNNRSAEEITMTDAVIVAARRTPTGKRNGVLSGVHPADLSAHVLADLVATAGVDPALVEDVIWGCVSQASEQTGDIARTAALSAGFPETVTGVTVDRQCGSSQQAVHFAAAGIIAGQYDSAIAGGVESMSRVPMGSSSMGNSPYGDRFLERYNGVKPNQGIGAEMIGEQWGFTRTQVDELAIESHARAAAATDSGAFESQIAP